MPNSEAGKPISRLNTLRLQSDRLLALQIAVKVLARLHLVTRDHRKYLGSLQPYSGNTWWALTSEACRYILSFVEQYQAVVDFFENTFAPEETFFHTILGNSDFKSRMRRNLVYEDWSTQGAHPEMIGERDLAFFEAQISVTVDDVFGSGEVLFARKYSDETLQLIDRVDAMIARKEALAVGTSVARG
jgi:hypothetical protein